jgi:ketosteroid isomerase-like protein
MDETSAATLVDEVYRTYRIDDRGPMLALLREDVVFRIEGDPDRLPFTGSGTVMPA